MSPSKIIYYSLNQTIRRTVQWVMGLVTTKLSKEEQLNVHKERVDKILLVRANFRMGNLILATPAIFLFRNAFPNARIDFVGAPMSGKLFRNLPIDHHFSITRRFPHSSWAYLALVKQLRSVGYDLAVDLSCSQSAMGSFIVGFSGARFRAGLQGKWDQWFDVRIPRPPERNKYRILPAFLRSLGLQSGEILPSLALSSAEKQEAKKRIDALVRQGWGPIVGVFVGGRKTRGKGWPIKNFCRLITALHWQGVNVITFFGPEEKNLIEVFSDALDPVIPLVFEPSPRDFAAMVSNCDLFITCDSGPMHLACALSTRTVALFQKPDFEHWGPPSNVARIVYQPGGTSVKEVLRTCLLDLVHNLKRLPDFYREGVLKPSPLLSIPKIRRAVRRLDMSLDMQRLSFFNKWAVALFFLALVIHSWLFPPSGFFAEGTWTEAFTDSFGIGSLIVGGFSRIWALSQAGKLTSLGPVKVPRFMTTGPYAYVRHPVDMGNFIIGAGLIFLSEAFFLIPLFVILIALQCRTIIPAKEKFLKEKFGEGFDLYCYLVPKYIPSSLPRRGFSFGRYFPLSELGNVWVIILAAIYFEWIEYPLHRRMIVDLFHVLGI